MLKKMQEFLTGDYDDADAASKRKMAAEARQISAWAAAAIAPMPIPFADIWTITPVQMMMVQAIGNIYGFKLDGKNLKALLTYCWRRVVRPADLSCALQTGNARHGRARGSRVCLRLDLCDGFCR
jgi:uncharacterized protein DUF697